MWKNKDPKPCPDCDEYGCKGRCCHYCGNIPEDILKSYLHFGDWAQSGGTLFKDWYLDSPGYRDNTMIY